MSYSTRAVGLVDMYRIRMIEIWVESTRFYTSQRFADKAIMILKKSSFSNFDILEICEPANSEQCEHELPFTHEML